jgi:hypothetical protein
LKTEEFEDENIFIQIALTHGGTGYSKGIIIGQVKVKPKE